MTGNNRGSQAPSRQDLVLPVYLPASLLSFSEGLLLPTLPVYALSFDVSFGQAALVLAAAGIGTMLADIPVGMVLSRLGMKPTMLIGAGLSTSAMFALALATFYPELVIYQLIHGIGRAMWSISRVSFIADYVPAGQRGRATSIFGGLNRIGAFLGPLVGGVVATQFGLSAAFYMAGILGLIAIAISIKYVDSSGHVQRHARHIRWGLVRTMMRTNRRDVTAASLAQVAGQMIRAGRQTIIPFYAESVLGLNVAQIGLIQSLSSLVDMALFFPAGHIMDRFGRKFTSVPSFGLMALAMALIPLTTSFATLLAVTMIMGIGNGLGSGAMMTLGTDLAPPGATAEFLGIWRFIGDSGRAGGPIVVGAMADSSGFGVTSLVLAAVGFASSLTLAVVVKETKDFHVVAKSGET